MTGKTDRHEFDKAGNTGEFSIRVGGGVTVLGQRLSSWREVRDGLGNGTSAGPATVRSSSYVKGANQTLHIGYARVGMIKGPWSQSESINGSKYRKRQPLMGVLWASALVRTSATEPDRQRRLWPINRRHLDNRQSQNLGSASSKNISPHVLLRGTSDLIPLISCHFPSGLAPNYIPCLPPPGGITLIPTIFVACLRPGITRSSRKSRPLGDFDPSFLQKAS